MTGHWVMSSCALGTISLQRKLNKHLLCPPEELNAPEWVYSHRSFSANYRVSGRVLLGVWADHLKGFVIASAKKL